LGKNPAQQRIRSPFLQDILMEPDDGEFFLKQIFSLLVLEKFKKI
jgi:hypothetical protein